jgi:hypothetical protein
VHRADSSGTTQNLQAYLAGAAPGAWQHPAEKEWQDKGGASADGSSDVASAVASAPGLIGCFELPFAVGEKISTVRADGHPAVLSSDVPGRITGRAADADEGGGGGAGPVTVAEQVQAWRVDGPRADGGDAAARAAQSQGRQMGERRAEAGAPDDRVGRRARAVGPDDAVTVEVYGHGQHLEPPGVPRLPHGRHGDDVSRRGDFAGVGAPFVEGAAAGGGSVEQGAAVDVVGEKAGRAQGDPGQVGVVGEVGGDLGTDVAAAHDHDALPGEVPRAAVLDGVRRRRRSAPGSSNGSAAGRSGRACSRGPRGGTQ